MTISATVLRLFIEALDNLQVDTESVLKECQIDAGLVQDPEARISLDRFERVWVTAQKLSGDPCIGLHAGEHIRAHAVNLWGYLMLSSATLGAGVQRVARFQQVLTGVPLVEIVDEADPSRLRIGAATGSDDFRAIHTEYVSALVPRVMGWVSDVEVIPQAVSFRHAARGPVDGYTSVLKCPVEFGTEHNEIAFSAATLARPSLHAEESLARVHVEFAERLLASQNEAELAPRVRRVLAESLEMGSADLASVARQLGMGTRSLQRRLSNEGTSFRAVLDSLRCEVAREHLERFHTPIAGVAHLTGFSDVSAFTRATSRWFGETPARLRERAERRSDTGRP